MKKLLACALLLVAGFAQAATFNLFSPANGVLKGNVNTFVTTPAASTDISVLWTGTCNSSTYLRGDGQCQTPPGAGGGTVNSVGLSAPSIFSVAGSPVTSTGTLALTFAGGQTANQFLATPDGTTGAVGLRSIALGDLPNLTVGKGGTGVVTITGPIKGNGTSAFSAAASADITGLWSGTCSASTFLRGDGSCQTPATGTGTVTSVGLTVPSGFSVTGSPVTTSGTLAISGTLNPAAGGTGVATLTGIAKGNGTSAFSVAVSGDVSGLWGGTCDATTYLRGDGTCVTPPTGGTSANPSATIGLTAVNGSAGTYLRSDGAPALSQSIAPTWTADHIFANTSSTALKIRASNSGATEGMSVSNSANTAGSDARIVLSAGGSSGGDPLLLYDISGVTDWYAGVDNSASDQYAIGTGATVGSGDHFVISTAGNVTVPAPSSGTAFTATGLANAFAGKFVGSSTSGQSRGLQVNAGTTAVDYALNITNQANTVDYVSVFGDGHFGIGYNGSAFSLTGSAAGNIAVPAPSSGSTLTLNGAAATNATTLTLAGTTTGSNAIVGSNSGATFIAGLESSSGGTLLTGAPAYATVLEAYTNTALSLGTNATERVRVSAAGGVTVNAPSSGAGLTVNGSSGTTPGLNIATGNLQLAGSSGTSGQVLTSNGTSAPSWTTITNKIASAYGITGNGSATGGAVTGNNAGFIGTFTNNTNAITLNFTVGYFTSTPTCVVSTTGSPLIAYVGAIGTSTVTISGYNYNSSAGAQVNYQIICNQ